MNKWSSGGYGNDELICSMNVSAPCGTSRCLWQYTWFQSSYGTRASEHCSVCTADQNIGLVLHSLGNGLWSGPSFLCRGDGSTFPSSPGPDSRYDTYQAARVIGIVRFCGHAVCNSDRRQQWKVTAPVWWLSGSMSLVGWAAGKLA